MNKKIGVMLFAGVMACMMTASVALAGCGGKRKPTFEMPETGFDTNAKITIKFDHTMGSNLTDVLDAYIPEFNKLYPNITVSHEQVGGYDDVRDNITKEIIAGNEPNIAYCYPDHVALYNRSKAVQSLTDFLPGGEYAGESYTFEKEVNGEKTEVEVPLVVTRADGTKERLALTDEQKDMFIQGYYNEGMEFGDGEMYTMPFSKSTEVLYYNKNYFEEHDLKVPTTWDEMEEVCERILEISKTETGIKTVPFGYDSEANWFITMCEQYGSDYTSATGKKFRFNNKTNRGFVEKFKEWYDKGYFTTQALYGSYTSGLFTATSDERIVMCIGSSAGASHQNPSKVDGKYPFEVGIAPIPQVNSSKPKAISQGPSVCIFKKSNPQEVLASWLFVKFLITNVEFQGDFSYASGYIPVLNSETMETYAEYKTFLDSADNNENLTALSVKVALQQEKAYYTSPAFVGSSEARDQAGALMQAVFTGSKTLEKAFKDAIEECEYNFG